MAFNINKFLTNIRDFGYLDSNSFEVFVQSPPVMVASGGALGNQGTPTSLKKISENLSYRIDQIRAPGISLITSDINHYGIGPTQKKPTNAQFQEVNISTLGDHYCEFWQYWYQWTRSVFQYNGTSSGQSPTYTAEYKDQYSSTIVILTYDHYGNIIQKINLFEAFPTSIREIPLSWSDSNLLRINVSIAYTEYTIEGSTIQRNTNQSNGLSNSREVESIVVGNTPNSFGR